MLGPLLMNCRTIANRHKWGRALERLSELEKEEGEDGTRTKVECLLEEGPHTIPKEWSRGTREARIDGGNLYALFHQELQAIH